MTVIKAFEEQNGIEIVLSGQRTDRHGRLDLVWKAAAWDTDPDNPEARLLALASVGCLEKRLETMEAVLMHLLYQLDFQLAELEFDKSIRQP
jgi:hypothetical protein